MGSDSIQTGFIDGWFGQLVKATPSRQTAAASAYGRESLPDKTNNSNVSQHQSVRLLPPFISRVFLTWIMVFTRSSGESNAFPYIQRKEHGVFKGVARGGVGFGCLWSSLHKPFFISKQHYNIQVAKTPWQYLHSKPLFCRLVCLLFSLLIWKMSH